MLPHTMLDILLSPWALGLFGLCVGSFLNVVIHRSPLMLEREWRADAAQILGMPLQGPVAPLNLSQPRSRCPFCGHHLAWYENIPVISFFLLGRKCSSCKTPISWRYPFIEILTALLFVLISWRFGPEPVAILWCAFAAMLIALSGIDWDTTLLPDHLTYPLLWGGLLAAAAGWTVPLDVSVWGAAAGYLCLWLVYWGFKLCTGQEGMGYGDFKLLAALGAWLGVKMLIPVIMAASLIGALVGMGMKVQQSLREGRYVPFGPFLAGAGIAVMLINPATVLAWLGWQ